MKSKLVVAIAITLASTLSHAEDDWKKKELDNRCFILSKLAKEEAEMGTNGASLGNLYSKLFNFRVIDRIGRADPEETKTAAHKELLQRVEKVQAAYDGLDKKLFSGEAKTKALNSAFYEMHNINKGVILDAHKSFPECNLVKDNSAPRAAQRSSKTSSSSSSSGSGAIK